MNYPVWELYFSGGGLLMVVIAVVHVYVAHFAVGGGLFLVLTEMKAYRENDGKILAYVKAHTRFFLLWTEGRLARPPDFIICAPLTATVSRA